MAEVSLVGTRGEYPRKPAKEYHVRVKMQAGPFAIDQKNQSLIRPQAMQPLGAVKK